MRRVWVGEGPPDSLEHAELCSRVGNVFPELRREFPVGMKGIRDEGQIPPIVDRDRIQAARTFLNEIGTLHGCFKICPGFL
jgi:hypothetical protein